MAEELALEGGDDIVIIPPELLAKATPEEQEAYFQYLLGKVKEVDDWEAWIKLIFPQYATKPFSAGHRDFWEWVWSVEIDNKPSTYVAIWSRGFAKSTSAEMAMAALAARGKRKYGLWVTETQDQSDDHVANVAALLESSTIEIAYPDLGKPAVNKQGQAKGWRRNRLVTASGFVLDACGLDSAARGIKFEAQRPDLIIFDDIDGELDGEATTAKKIKVITQKLLPAGAPNVAVLAVQNLVHENSIFAQLADGRADFLMDRIVSGPIPAIEGLEIEERTEEEPVLDKEGNPELDEDGKPKVVAKRFWEIVSGEPTWPEGFPLEVCQRLINQFGLTAFLAECQHITSPPDGDIFAHLNFGAIEVDWDDLPSLKRVVVWVDPAVTSTDTSDCMGIQADGLGKDNKIYRLWSWEQRSTPYKTIRKAVEKALEFNATTVGVETNQGGETWRDIYDQVIEDLRRESARDGEDFFRKMPRYKEVKVTKDMGSKVVRAERMLVDYERDMFRHVRGTHHVLVAALKRFPRIKPFDLVDASVHSWSELAGPLARRKVRFKSAARRTLGRGMGVDGAPSGR